MIHSFAWEYDNREDLDETAKHLWNKLGITGELDIVPLEGDRWRLTVHSERPIRESTLESLKGESVQAKSIISKS